ncbi:hypothetical protein Q2K19_05500 [Micromonospora soli]|uniref:hypothetical protein n=1 Tax=Micromonospora sp. NBRC 110009 TaxID=3061627 RepID=UPI00267145D7|nr:hypothetical protein [Micromonospora sp. NBRC 110009]WKT99944.1 hypothetical protein Q2K19_05500 [Micromonospora sp. NBRC 110009]
MGEHISWADLRERRAAEPDADEAYEAARIEFELRQTIRDLRRRSGSHLRRRPARR